MADSINFQLQDNSKNRDSLIIYRSFYEAIKELPVQNQSEVWNAIFEFALNFNEIEISGLSKTIFTLIKPNLEANIKRYKSGIQPKEKQRISETEAKQKRKTSKSKANKDKDKDKDVDKDVNENKDKNVNNNYPTVEEVSKFFVENGYRPELGIKAFEHYSVGDWKDTNGNKVKNWKQKMKSVWMAEGKNTEYKTVATGEIVKTKFGALKQFHPNPQTVDGFHSGMHPDEKFHSKIIGGRWVYDRIFS